MRIHLISSPRNLSTALMYSFAQRADMRVVDEPFYAYYLAQSGADHPGRKEVLSSQPQDLERVLHGLDGIDDRQHLFLKGMAHHCEGLPVHRLAEMTSVFYIRDPKRIIASFAEVIPNPSLRDIGLRMAAELMDSLQRAGGRCLVLDSDDLLSDPQGVLTSLCNALGIGFDERMLRWEAGPRPEDGVWAKYWYANVHRSTGFAKQATSDRELPDHLRSLYEEALPYYRRLQQLRITA